MTIIENRTGIEVRTPGDITEASAHAEIPPEDVEEFILLYGIACDSVLGDDRPEDIPLAPSQTFQTLREINDDITDRFAQLVLKYNYYSDDAEKKMYEAFVNRKETLRQDAEKKYVETLARAAIKEAMYWDAVQRSERFNL